MTINFGDCLGPEGLATLADQSVDHIITDPPYSQRTQSNSFRVSRNGIAIRDFQFDHLSEEDIPVLAAEFARVVRRWVLVFSDDVLISTWRTALESAGLRYARIGVWVKRNPTPRFSGDGPGAGCEFIHIAHRAKQRSRWNGGGRAGIWRTKIARGDERTEHKAQKPIELMDALIRDFTNPNEIICDPFLGTGTTLVSAKRLGRDGIGWEADPKYYDLAKRSIDEAREQLRMFSV